MISPKLVKTAQKNPALNNDPSGEDYDDFDPLNFAPISNVRTLGRSGSFMENEVIMNEYQNLNQFSNSNFPNNIGGLRKEDSTADSLKDCNYMKSAKKLNFFNYTEKHSPEDEGCSPFKAFGIERCDQKDGEGDDDDIEMTDEEAEADK